MRTYGGRISHDEFQHKCPREESFKRYSTSLQAKSIATKPNVSKLDPCPDESMAVPKRRGFFGKALIH